MNEPEVKREVTLNLPEMRKMKIFIATPMYGGMCHGLYTKSLMDTISMVTGHGIPTQIYYMFNESLVTRARNYCVANFLKSDATHLWFIDSDIAWKAMDALYMMHLIAEDRGYSLNICIRLRSNKSVSKNAPPHSFVFP